MAEVQRSSSTDRWNDDQFRLMRSYSDHLEDHETGRDSTGRLLNAAVIQDVCRRERERDEATAWEKRAKAHDARLEKKGSELRAAMERYLRTLSADQKRALTADGNDFTAIMSIMETSVFDWTHRAQHRGTVGGSVKNFFHKSCKALDEHASMLEMLPQQSEYVSLFYGGLKTIIQASINYQMVASGLPDVLTNINNTIQAVQKEIRRSPGTKFEMSDVVTDLYVLTFDLFTKVIKWCDAKSRNHVWKVLKRDCWSEFANEVNKIKDISQWVLRDVISKTAETVQFTAEHVAGMRKDVNHLTNIANKHYLNKQDDGGLKAIEQDHTKLLQNSPSIIICNRDNAMLERFLQSFQNMGSSGTNLLIESIPTAESSSPEIRIRRSPSPLALQAPSSTRELDLDMAPEYSDPSPSSQVMTAEQVLENSENLETYYPSGHTTLLISPLASADLPLNVADRLVQWLSQPNAQILNLQIDSLPDQDIASSTLIAAHTLSLAASIPDQPTLSYFCSLRRPNEMPQGQTRTAETIGLCEMMACVIRQLVTLLPDTLPTSTLDFSQDRFETLDGTLRTWSETIGVFADLLSLAPSDLLIVINDLQLLDHRYTSDKIREVLDVIRRFAGSTSEESGMVREKRVKILLTTAGSSRSVLPWLQKGEWYLHENSGPKRRGRVSGAEMDFARV